MLNSEQIPQKLILQIRVFDDVSNRIDMVVVCKYWKIHDCRAQQGLSNQLLNIKIWGVQGIKQNYGKYTLKNTKK